MKKLYWFYIMIFWISGTMSSCNRPQKTQPDTLPVMLSASGRTASCVFLSEDNKNNPMVSWVEEDSTKQKFFFFSLYDKKKRIFSAPVPVPIAANASIHEEGMPKVIMKGNGTLFALYETSTPVKGKRWGLGDMRYQQSSDGGKHWTTPQSVAPADIADSLSGSFANLSRLTDGEIGITWLGTKKHASTGMEDMMDMSDNKMMMHGDMSAMKGRPVKFAKTNKSGGVGIPVVISEEACECCRTALSSDKNGNIYIAFRNLLPGNVRDISFSKSSDDGHTFSAPVSFSHDGWVINGCPHDGPSIVSGSDGAYVSWFTGSPKNMGVNLAKLNGDGSVAVRNHISSDGRFIQVCTISDGVPVVVYNRNVMQGASSHSRIMLAGYSGNHLWEKRISLTDSVDASYPVVIPANNKEVIVAWSQGAGVYYRVVSVGAVKNAADKTAGW